MFLLSHLLSLIVSISLWKKYFHQQNHKVKLFLNLDILHIYNVLSLSENNLSIYLQYKVCILLICWLDKVIHNSLSGFLEWEDPKARHKKAVDSLTTQRYKETKNRAGKKKNRESSESRIPKAGRQTGKNRVLENYDT